MGWLLQKTPVTIPESLIWQFQCTQSVQDHRTYNDLSGSRRRAFVVRTAVSRVERLFKTTKNASSGRWSAEPSLTVRTQHIVGRRGRSGHGHARFVFFSSRCTDGAVSLACVGLTV